jgi:hypothetical protein
MVHVKEDAYLIYACTYACSGYSSKDITETHLLAPCASSSRGSQRAGGKLPPNIQASAIVVSVA